MHIRLIQLMFAAVTMTCCTGTVKAEVQLFVDFAEWQSLTGAFSTVDFTGFPAGTFITDQYEALGAVFTDGNDNIHLSASHQLDGAGLDGNLAIDIAFVSPMTSLALHFPGHAQIDLFSNGSTIYSSPIVSGGGAGALGFVGVTSSVSFDSARIVDPTGGPLTPFDNVSIDNLYVGPPIPAPGTIMLLAFASIQHKRRRRC